MATYPSPDRSDIQADGLDATFRTVNIDLTFTAGTAGAIPATLTRSNLIASVALNTNEYTTTFQNIWAELINVIATVAPATPATGSAVTPVLTTVNVGAGSTSPNTVGVTFYKGDGTGALHVAAGDVVRIRYVMKR